MNLNRRIISAALLSTFAFSGVLARADDELKDVKTSTKKIPLPTEVQAEFPSKADPNKIVKKWATAVIWSKQLYRAFTPAHNGFEAVLASPEVIYAFSLNKAKEQLFDVKETEALYKDRFEKYYGTKPEGQFYGNKITFFVILKLNSDVFRKDAIEGEWSYYLYTVNGKRYKPVAVEYEEVKRIETDPLLGHTPDAWIRNAKVTFENSDPETKQPILTADIKEISFVVAGKPGRGRARFEFEQKKK